MFGGGRYSGGVVSRRPYDAKVSARGYIAIYIGMFLAVLMLLAYITVRLVMSFGEREYSTADFVLAMLLLGAELFMAMHAVGYFFNIVKAGLRQGHAEPIVFSRHV